MRGKSDAAAAGPHHALHMRAPVRWLMRTLPPSALATLALAAMVLTASLLSGLAARAGDLGASPTPSLAPTAGVSAPPVATPRTPAPTAVPTVASDGSPQLLARSPDAGGVIFETTKGVWRYDGSAGYLWRLGDHGRATADRTQYIVRRDDEHLFFLADAASGNLAALAPTDAIDVDWVGAGRPMAFVDASGLTFYAGLRTVSVPLPRAQFVRLSPDGSRAIVGVAADIAAPGPKIVNELVLVTLAAPRPRTLVTLTAGWMGPTIVPASWSPDGQFFAYLAESTSASMSADGVRLAVLDATQGRVTELAVTTPSTAHLAWTAPHTLAYVAGGNRESWLNKTLRTWSPESGIRDISKQGEVGLNPSWSADGATLYYMSGPSVPYDPLAFFRGDASGDRRLAIADLRTGQCDVRLLQGITRTEGARAARSGPLMLVLLRRVVVFSSPSTSMDAVPLDIATYDTVTQMVTPLVRIPSVGMGFYGGYSGPEQMAWSR